MSSCCLWAVRPPWHRKPCCKPDLKAVRSTPPRRKETEGALRVEENEVFLLALTVPGYESLCKEPAF